MDDYFNLLHLDDKDRKDEKKILDEAGVLVKIQDNIFISVRTYIQYVLSKINESSKLAKKLDSLDAVTIYELHARYCLNDWAVIIRHLSYHLANEHKHESVDETVKILEKLIENFRRIFEHLIEANRLFTRFGRVLNDNPAESK